MPKGAKIKRSKPYAMPFKFTVRNVVKNLDFGHRDGVSLAPYMKHLKPAWVLAFHGF